MLPVERLNISPTVHRSWRRGRGRTRPVDSHLAAAAGALLLLAHFGAALVQQVDEDVQQEQDADAVQVGEERLPQTHTQTEVGTSEL